MAGSHTACGPQVRKPCPTLIPLFYKVEHRTSNDQDQNATQQWRRAQIPNLFHSFIHSFILQILTECILSARCRLKLWSQP